MRRAGIGYNYGVKRDWYVLHVKPRTEKKAAAYFNDHRKTLGDCPGDSLDYYMGILFADASISVCSDALELLKNSSLFQKIGDEALSMKIIRAYDTCGAIVTTMNRHISERTERFDRAVTVDTAGQYTYGGHIDIRKFLQAPYGVYSVQWVAGQPDPSVFNDVSDVLAAVEAIDAYIRK